MKFTVAATVLASSIIATAESLPIPAGGSLSNAANEASHRSLAVSMRGQDDIKGILKERRSLKKTNNVIRSLQDKLKRSKLRNQAAEDDSMSNAELDLGLFSRNLQQNITEPEEENVIEGLVNLCYENAACSCSNVDVDAYTANVVCSFEEYCYAEPNACNVDVDFCYETTYELDVTAPATGSSKSCWTVNSPLAFSYCYGQTYSGEEGYPSSCFLELNGSQCNSCELVVGNDPNDFCTTYDCSNVDADVSGTECGDKTIVIKKVEDHLIYSPLPCENGCNICPQGEEMTIFDKYVTFTLNTDEEYTYSCSNLNLAGLMGELNYVPGDLCYSLESVVDGPCGCEATPTPVDNEGVLSTEAPVEVTIEDPNEGSSEFLGESAGARFGSDGFAIVAIVASIFSWTMM